MVFLDHSSYQHLQGLVRWSGKSQGRSSISACSLLIWSYRVGASSISLVQVYQQWDLDMCKTTGFHLKFIASCLSMGKLIFINQLIMTKKSMAPPSTNPPSTASLLFVVRVQREPLPAVAAQPHGPDSRCSSCSSSLINRKTLKTEQHIQGNDMLICDAISDALPVPLQLMTTSRIPGLKSLSCRRSLCEQSIPNFFHRLSPTGCAIRTTKQAVYAT